MKATRRTHITLETTETITLRREAGSVSASRPERGSSCGFVSPGQAAARRDLDIRAVGRELAAGRLHVISTADGSLLVCLDSVETIVQQFPAGNPNPQPKSTQENHE